MENHNFPLCLHIYEHCISNAWEVKICKLCFYSFLLCLKFKWFRDKLKIWRRSYCIMNFLSCRHKISKLISNLINFSATGSVSEPPHHKSRQSFNQQFWQIQLNQSRNQSISQPGNQSINRSARRSFTYSKSFNQSWDQSVIQSESIISQVVRRALTLFW